MVVALQYLTAGLYLLASLAAGAGFTLARPAMLRAAVAVLAAGALAHGASFTLLHTAEPTPPLTHLPSALSFMAWVGTVGFLLLAWRARLAGLVALVAPMSCLGVAAAVFSTSAPRRAARRCARARDRCRTRTCCSRARGSRCSASRGSRASRSSSSTAASSASARSRRRGAGPRSRRSIARARSRWRRDSRC